MIDGFRWCFCCALVLMQFVLSPIATNAAAEMQLAGATLKSSPPKEPSAQHGNLPVPVDSNPKLLQVSISAGKEMVAPGEVVSYELAVTNTSTLLVANESRLIDLVPSSFKLKKGSVQLNGISASDPTISEDGRALTFAVGNLAPGASSKIRFEAEIAAGSPQEKADSFASAISSDNGTSNIAKRTVTVSGDLQQAKVAAALETTIPVAAPPPVLTAPLAIPKVPETPVDSDSSLLLVSVTAGRGMVAPGEVISYDLTVTNTSKLLVAPDVRLMDVLPTCFRFNKGSARINGSSSPDPLISADGRALTFAAGDLAPGASATLRFEAEITAECPADKAANVASAFSGGSGTSNIAKVTVTVRENLQQTKTAATISPVVPIETLHPPVEVKSSDLMTPAVAAG